MRHNLLMLCLLALLTAGCSVSTGVQESGDLVRDPNIVAAGADLYASTCASCHGTDLRGTDQGPSHLSVVYEPGHHSDTAFLLAVRRGVSAHHWPFGSMPPIENLTDAEVEAIVVFVRDIQEREGFEPYPP